MDFYSFKNHMQKLVVIDFPHHITKKNQLFIVYYKKNNNYNFLNSSINQPGPNPCSLIVHPDPTRVAGWVRVGSGLGPIAGL